MTNTHTRITFSVLVLLVLLTAAIAGCQQTEILRNPEIERWCGNRPCSWQVSGKVERVGTWNLDDYAVALESTHAELWQESGHIGNDALGQCFHVGLLAKLDPGVRVFVDADFSPGAGVDWSKQLPEGDFVPIKYDIAPPTWFDRVRFTIRKDGAGRAVIAKLRVIADGTGCGAADAAIEVDDRPLGANCDTDSQCRSGTCSNRWFFSFTGSQSNTCICPAAPDGGPDAGAYGSADAGDAAVSCGCSSALGARDAGDAGDAACAAP